MTKIEKLLNYQYQVNGQALEMIIQANPFTAYGEGLANISRALGLRGRMDVEDTNATNEVIPGIRSETDIELRDRILKYLEVEVL